jgi:raffinose/stachyose/melibiose transport system substrate-binding protein
MTRKRVLTLALAALMLIALLAACASTAAPGGGTASPPAGGNGGGNGGETPEEVELRVLNYIDLSGAGATEELDVIWKAFESANPHIKLVRQDEFEESYHNAVEANAAAGTLWDVMYAWPSGRSTTLHRQRLLKDLTPLIQRDGIASNYIPLAMDPAGQAGGYQAILPQSNTSSHAFYINHEVLNDVGLEPAKTYSELVAQVPILREAGYDTIVMPNLSTWVMQSCLYSLVIGRFMGADWHERIHSGETDWSDPAFIASLDFIKQMYDDGVLPQSSLALDYGEGPGAFATNKGAYYIDGDWRLGAFITDQTTGEALIDPSRQESFSIGVFPEIDLPGVALPARSTSSVLGTGWGINANIEDGSAKLEAAWTLVKWLSGKEVQSFRLRTGGLAIPSWVGIDIASLPLEPLQVEMTGFSDSFDVATVVVDGVFEGPVYTPLNDGLQALGMGSQTSEEVAALVQAAFDTWKANQ